VEILNDGPSVRRDNEGNPVREQVGDSMFDAAGQRANQDVLIYHRKWRTGQDAEFAIFGQVQRQGITLTEVWMPLPCDHETTPG